MEQVSIAPLVVFRIIFGGMMLGSIIRFWLNGWIEDLYIKPVFFFTYYGFEWVKPLGETGTYLIFIVMALSALMVMIGFKYRLSSIAFFLTFTYVELIDKTNYLNHYYFISIVAFLMIFLPAGRNFSLDVYFDQQKKLTHIPRVFIFTIQLQLGIVYFFAGVAKLNYDWLFEAQPLRIWLQPHTDLPVLGYFMDKIWIAYFFSWFGAIYDLSIPFFLSFKKTRGYAYFFVIAFHVLTRVLFQIGMFPYIMILATLIFFSESFHVKLLGYISKPFIRSKELIHSEGRAFHFGSLFKKMFLTFIAIHFFIQIILPFRYVLYPGKLFWTEQGFRFSWRVMLMEKAGKAFFYVTDKKTGRVGETMMDNDLTPNQEKMMSTQPDFILQYAHHLEKKYKAMGMVDPKITVDCYVTLNGSGSRPYINKYVDLTKIKDGFHHKWWILPFEESAN
ncbi:MAG: HTTM domain-containing protein [Bacteroidetes bacterium]|nr:HTTM domain-containing protein [Bacteroidota bacterium]